MGPKRGGRSRRHHGAQPDPAAEEPSMPHSYTQLYVHFVWATWNRAPIITPALEAPLYACIARECLHLKCEVIALGGTKDHLHALVRLYPTVSVATLAKAMKGA